MPRLDITHPQLQLNKPISPPMSQNISELIKQAAEAAKSAPEHLQEIAFSKAFDALQQPSSRKPSNPDPKRERGGKKSETKNSDVDLEKLDRTAHPEIVHSDSALNNSLRVLRAVKDDLGLDGLAAGSIAAVLVDKFRCTLTRRSVARALNGAGKYVNRHKEGQVVIFRLMAPGEEYLEQQAHSDGAIETPVKKSPARKAKKAGKKRATKKKASGKGAPVRRAKSGPASAMGQIFDQGYFSSPRTIGAIILKLKHDLGRQFKQNELSPVLLRWIRNGKLKRSENAEKQYEYQQS
jgi:hypothetical protein